MLRCFSAHQHSKKWLYKLLYLSWQLKAICQFLFPLGPATMSWSKSQWLQALHYFYIFVHALCIFYIVCIYWAQVCADSSQVTVYVRRFLENAVAHVCNSDHKAVFSCNKSIIFHLGLHSQFQTWGAHQKMTRLGLLSSTTWPYVWIVFWILNRTCMLKTNCITKMFSSCFPTGLLSQ